MPAKYFILSCDGGGLRGLLTAHLIKKLAEDCGNHFLDRVGLFAGTSTGGILALGLAGGKSITEMINLYTKFAGTIFPDTPPPTRGEQRTVAAVRAVVPDRWPGAEAHATEYAVRTYRKLFDTKYKSNGLEEALKAAFGHGRVISGFDRKVLVTTFRLDSPAGSWGPVALHNLPVPREPLVESHVLEAALCTAAAPTYFPPYWHGRLGYCVDGGVFANNPASLALSYALKAGVAKLDEVAVLSIGTGGRLARLPLAPPGAGAGAGFKPEYLGLAPWMLPKALPAPHNTPETPLLSAVFDGTAECDRLVCEGLLRNCYLRVQVPLREVIELDDTTKLGALEREARDYTAAPAWAGIVGWVKEQLGIP